MRHKGDNYSYISTTLSVLQKFTKGYRDLKLEPGVPGGGRAQLKKYFLKMLRKIYFYF